MTKVTRDQVRDHFREQLKYNANTKINQDSDKTYKWVITTYEHDPERAVRYMDKGWDVVYDGDDSDLARLKPLTKSLKGGHKAILMSIPKERHKQNQLDRIKADKERHERSLNARKSKKITSEGGTQITYQSDIDLDSSET
jgi:hypothetical protein